MFSFLSKALAMKQYILSCAAISLIAFTLPVSAQWSPFVVANAGVSVGLGWDSCRAREFNEPWRWDRARDPFFERFHRPSWGYYGDRYRYPYRYLRPCFRHPKPQLKVVTPPERITTSVSYTSDLTHLPENAKVIQKEGKTLYQWQGAEYQFDWKTQTYHKLD